MNERTGDLPPLNTNAARPPARFDTPPLLRLAFRPFFLGALVYAVVGTLVWTMQFHHGWPTGFSRITPAQWHAHEMIFGYALAVIAGFLLTAVQTWTGERSIHGNALLVLFVLWLVPRAGAIAFPGDAMAWVALGAAALFHPALLVAFLRPIVRTKNHNQWGIVGKLMVLAALDLAFLGAALGLGFDPAWASPLLLVGVYTVLGLVLMMSQRVLPFFIEQGLPEVASVSRAARWNVPMMMAFLVFAAADVMSSVWGDVGGDGGVTRLVAGVGVAFVGAIKLATWHRPGIWPKPLLWVLFIAYGMILAGVLLRALGPWTEMFPSLALHLMTYGGIGMMTAGMMARVTLGHTGRSVAAPPPGLGIAFGLLALGAVFRSLVPVAWPDGYLTCLLVSQALWSAAFIVLLALFAKPLMTTRADGADG